jgi:hypothetical protein
MEHCDAGEREDREKGGIDGKIDRLTKGNEMK